MVRPLGIRRESFVILFSFSALILLLITFQAPTTLQHLPRAASRLASVAEFPTQSVRNTTTFPKLVKSNASVIITHKAKKTEGAKIITKGLNTTKTALPPGTVLIGDLYVAGHARPHPELCPALGARLRLLILVMSAPANAAARESVRLTWGHVAQRSDVGFGFMLGAFPPKLRAHLDLEDALYGDLIEGYFFDSYKNLTLKSLSVLEWVDTYCSKVPRFLKTDDDVFINVNRLLEFAEAPARCNATNTLWGHLWKHSIVQRNPRSKHYVPLNQWPGRVFPDYLNGPAYVMTADVVKRMFEASLTEPYFFLEDIFVTGVLATKVRGLASRLSDSVDVSGEGHTQDCICYDQTTCTERSDIGEPAQHIQQNIKA